MSGAALLESPAEVFNDRVFSESWWRELLDDSGGLLGPSLIKGSVPEDLFSEDDLLRVLQEIPHRQSLGQPGVRVYVDGGERAPELVQLYREPVRKGESLRGVVERLFGDRPFGIIVNHAGRFLPDLTERLAPLYQGLTERLGVPWVSLNPTLFVGNYGYTPFGVHFDGDAKSVIHFHQGPGTKTMTLWDPDSFVQLTGSRLHYCEPEKILPHGTSYDIEAGDTFYLPEGPFHIGYTPDFSVGLSVVIRGISAADWLDAAWRESTAGSFAGSLMSRFDVDVETLLEQGLVDPSVARKSVADWIGETLSDYRARLESNCGFQKETEWCDEAPSPVGLRLRSVAPFRLSVRSSADGSRTVYARGRALKIAVQDLDLQWLAAVDNGEVLDVDQLIASQPAHRTALERLLGELLRIRAARPTDEPAST